MIGTHFMASNRPSGKRRNAPDGRFHATGGRVLLPEASVALPLKCGTLLRKALLAFGQNNPGEMGPYHCRLVLIEGTASAEHNCSTMQVRRTCIAGVAAERAAISVPPYAVATASCGAPADTSVWAGYRGR
jgi:hypothetical protein